MDKIINEEDDDKVIDFTEAKLEIERREFLEQFATIEYLAQLKACEKVDLDSRYKLKGLLKRKEHTYRMNSYASKKNKLGFLGKRKEKKLKGEIQEIKSEIADLDECLKYTRQEINVVEFYLGIDE